MRLFRPHFCPYCLTKVLEPARLRWWQYPLLLLLVRPFRCPHCFERLFRGWL